MAAIDIDQLVVRRRGNTVLDRIDLAVREGSVTALLGPSGSGKTTLLRVLVGAQRTTSGTAHVLGRPAGHAVLRGEIGYTTQVASVYPDLTALENVRYHATLHGAGRAAALAALAKVDLADYADRLVRALSGGQVNRVSLACALVGRPRLLLLDEPTVGLDPVLRRDLWALFRAEASDNGTTLVVSSHVLDEAAHCDRLLLLRDGRLIADDTPAGLLRATAAADLDDAFLTLVTTQEVPA
ncbi:MAG TPA: ABC transporter ATP-binding protein [Pseudonocardiaceae bacterium]|jgi:ABC-2 type transport system ATP-binding protein|nr:ABC transporter ATP-binding protein [Pseudonocardiaceae bacterium]